MLNIVKKIPKNHYLTSEIIAREFTFMSIKVYGGDWADYLDDARLRFEDLSQFEECDLLMPLDWFSHKYFGELYRLANVSEHSLTFQ